MSITITVPNDDHVALRAMSKALEEIAVARGASLQVNLVTQEMLDKLKETRAGNIVCEPEVDTTSEQVESLSSVVNREVHFDNPSPQLSDNTTDSNGTPWDERIHSASKALNADGTWRLRRKPKDMDETEWSQFVDATLIEIMPDNNTDDMGQVVDKHISAAHQHVTERYGQGLANAAFTGDRNTAPDSIITNALKVGEPVEVAEGEFSQAYVFKSEPSVTPAGDDFHVDAGEVTEQQIASIPVPPLPVPPVHMTFPQVMQFLTERHGRITSAQVDDIIADMGLNSIMDLNTQPEYTGPFIARVKALLGE
ncbi:hypothetical protein AAM22_gp63 [Pantoea phage vB_PagM_AAM22]|nr:hypothetical protein AAM22_gp63 [Pantoea phage vB_PagM_AAM22]